MLLLSHCSSSVVPCITPLTLLLTHCHSFRIDTLHVLSFIYFCCFSHVVVLFTLSFLSCCCSSHVTAHGLFLPCGSSPVIPLLPCHSSHTTPPPLVLSCHSSHIALPTLFIGCYLSRVEATTTLLLLQHLSRNHSSCAIFPKYLLTYCMLFFLCYRCCFSHTNALFFLVCMVLPPYPCHM